VSTDSDIIRQSRDSPRAFGELFRRHAPRLHRYASRRAGQAVADDVTSETFLVAFERRATFDHDWDDAAPWLFGIATTLIHKHHRAEARLLRTLAKAAAPDNVDDETVRASERVDAAASVGLLASQLRKLSAADRDCLLLYAWADLSYDEIAAAMHVPVGTVRSRLNRARRLLRGTTTSQEMDYGRADTAPRNA